MEVVGVSVAEPSRQLGGDPAVMLEISQLSPSVP